VAAINELLAAEGCYLYKDAEKGRWVRSGKVVGTGRNSDVRNKEHARASQLLTAADLASFFYQSYHTTLHTSKGCSTLEEKQLHMVGCLFELVYDLMPPPLDNASRSPGFETPLVIFGGSAV